MDRIDVYLDNISYFIQFLFSLLSVLVFRFIGMIGVLFGVLIDVLILFLVGVKSKSLPSLLVIHSPNPIRIRPLAALKIYTTIYMDL